MMKRVSTILILVILFQFGINLGVSSMGYHPISEVIQPQITNATYVSVKLGGISTSVNDGVTLNITVKFQTDDVNKTLVDLSLSTTEGHFANNLTDTSVQFKAANVTLWFLWTAPVIYQKQSLNANISTTATMDTLTASDYNIVKVNPVFYDFSVTWIQPTQIFQDQTAAPIEIQVKNKVNSSLVYNATVSLNLEIGVFTGTNRSDIVVFTNQSGVAKAYMNFKPVSFIYDKNTVSVSAIITKPKYNDLTSNTTLTVIKGANKPSASVKFSTHTDGGISIVEILISAKLNGNPWWNATFKVIANAGQFENGQQTISVKTNSSGLILTTWNSSKIPKHVDDLSVFFVVKLQSLDYGNFFKDQNYTLSLKGTPTTISIPSSKNPSPLNISSIIISFIITVIIFRRKIFK